VNKQIEALEGKIDISRTQIPNNDRF